MDQSLPSLEELYHMSLPPMDNNARTQLFFECLTANLPQEYAGRLYKDAGGLSSLPIDFRDFLGDAATAPVLRVAGVTGLLSKMAADSHFREDDRNKIDLDKTSLFWRIIGKDAATDAKTASGQGWLPAFISSLPAQAECVLDNCHLWTFLTVWPEGHEYFQDSTSKDQVDEQFATLQARVSSQMAVLKLVQTALSGQPNYLQNLQQTIYSFFIKLGLLERASQRKDDTVVTPAVPGDLESTRDSQPVESWAAGPLTSSLVKTRACIQSLCDTLATQMGGDDDTICASIRSIPDHLTNNVGGANFLDPWLITWAPSKAQKLTMEETLEKTIAIKFIAPELGGSALPVISLIPPVIQVTGKREEGSSFISKYATQMECCKA